DYSQTPTSQGLQLRNQTIQPEEVLIISLINYLFLLQPLFPTSSNLFSLFCLSISSLLTPAINKPSSVSEVLSASTISTIFPSYITAIRSETSMISSSSKLINKTALL